VQGNLDKLAGSGYGFVQPRESLLACGDVGRGAMADVNVIKQEIDRLLGGN